MVEEIKLPRVRSAVMRRAIALQRQDSFLFPDGNPMRDIRLRLGIYSIFPDCVHSRHQSLSLFYAEKARMDAFAETDPKFRKELYQPSEIAAKVLSVADGRRATSAVLGLTAAILTIPQAGGVERKLHNAAKVAADLVKRAQDPKKRVVWLDGISGEVRGAKGPSTVKDISEAFNKSRLLHVLAAGVACHQTLAHRHIFAESDLTPDDLVFLRTVAHFETCLNSMSSRTFDLIPIAEFLPAPIFDLPPEGLSEETKAELRKLRRKFGGFDFP